MRTVLAILAGWTVAQAQTQDFAPPPPNAPDAATLKQIQEKTAELKTAVEAIQKKDDVYADVAVYWKAAEWIVRHNEWYVKDIGKQTLIMLDAGLERARQAKAGQSPWREVRNKPVIRGYISAIDRSIQPYSVTLPAGFGTDGKLYRLDCVLHGRNATLTEAGFIGGKEMAKAAAKGNDYAILEVYGRGNNAYRWAGEADVFEALQSFASTPVWGKATDPRQRIIRGFSMGGAGTWHLGLHHPFSFSAMSPGAGFTVTHGYVPKLGPQPDYIERCLHIYDAVDYAENLFDIPCVAYSGELDKQRAAVENVEARLKDFKEKLRYTHIIGTGLEHKQPPEWWAKVDAQLRKDLAGLPERGPERVRFVTFTTRYNDFGHGTIEAMETQYEKAVIESVIKDHEVTITTKNVSALRVGKSDQPAPKSITIDNQKVAVTDITTMLAKKDGKWTRGNPGVLHKYPGLQGPIDDAFHERFVVVDPKGTAWHPDVTEATTAASRQFNKVWDKYFRGHIVKETAEEAIAIGPDEVKPTVLLFGDPGSNPAIKHYLKHLPIEWSEKTLVVNGKSYEPKTHYPVMIYPHPHRWNCPGSRGIGYIVLNSGHTFGEADLKGTNALLYPRLGDWAVMKLAPTKDDPHHTEVVDAGIFDANWQFEKK